MSLKTIKVTVLKSSKRLGLFAAVGGSRWRTHRLLILCYHGISQHDEHLWNSALYLSQDVFRRQLQLLVRNNCSVLSLQEALSRLARNELPPRSVVITFDDGAYDFLTRALPVIREFRFPVTVYQTSFYSAFNRPVFDVACSYILWKGAAKRIEGREFTGGPGLIDLSTEACRDAVCRQIRQTAHTMGMSAEGKDQLLMKLAASLEVDWEPIRTRRLLHLMKPGELQQVLTEGVDLQLHTHRHRMPRDRSLFEREIIENRNFLAEIGQSSATHFCYPSGDHDACFLPWLAELDVESATITDTAALASRKSHPLLLPRVVVPSTLSDVEFEGWLHGFSQALPRRPMRRPVPLSTMRAPENGTVTIQSAE